MKIPDPDFECVSENILDSWQQGNKLFKKVNFYSELGHFADSLLLLVSQLKTHGMRLDRVSFVVHL